MKKIYSALALTMAVGVNAVAAVPSVELSQAVSDSNVANVEMTQDSRMKAPAKVLDLTTPDQLAGTYRLVCYSGYSSGEMEQTITIKKVSDTEVMVYGFYNRGEGTAAGGIGVKGTVVAAEDRTTIVFKEQAVAQFHNQDGSLSNDYMYFYPGDINQVSGENTTNFTVDEMVLTVCPTGITVSYNDGTQEHKYEEGCICGLGTNTFILSSDKEKANTGVGYSMLYSIKFLPIDLYCDDAQQLVEINENEWTSCGKGKFQDGYVYPLSTGQVLDAYDVEVLKKNGEENVYLIKNPYGVGTPYADYNDGVNDTGYIYIDASNEGFVFVRPLIYSGYFDGTEKGGWEGFMYMSNDEGVMYYLDESSIEDIQDTFDYYEDLEPSSIVKDGTNVTINIRNGALASNCDIYTYAAFTNTSGNLIPCESTLVFDEAAGVNNIIEDANAPARYFNLQGVEIANPEAGQIVIVKNGNKASKTIAK